MNVSFLVELLISLRFGWLSWASKTQVIEYAFESHAELNIEVNKRSGAKLYLNTKAYAFLEDSRHLNAHKTNHL